MVDLPKTLKSEGLKKVLIEKWRSRVARYESNTLQFPLAIQPSDTWRFFIVMVFERTIFQSASFMQRLFFPSPTPGS